MTACPCGTGREYAQCCGPRHLGETPAETPEALMRSRYAAFARGDGAYLVRTIASTTETAESLSTWARSVTWVGLAVHSTEVDPSGLAGTVSFTARYLEGGREIALSEVSRFERRNSVWLYLDGVTRVTERKPERNERCPCGSGKKFKQCHG